MDLQAIGEAAKVIPVFMRNEGDEQAPMALSPGCFACDHTAAQLGTRNLYLTCVLYGEHDNGSWEKPLVGFTVGMADTSYQDLSRYHWLKEAASNAGAGARTSWITKFGLEESPTMFVRLLNEFDNQGVQHKHSRTNLYDFVENEEGMDIFVALFTSVSGRGGFYVDPVEDLQYARKWQTLELNTYVHSMLNQQEINRVMEYYWGPNRPSRLTRVTPDGMVNNQPVADRDILFARRHVETTTTLQALRRAEQAIARDTLARVMFPPPPAAIEDDFEEEEEY